MASRLWKWPGGAFWVWPLGRHNNAPAHDLVRTFGVQIVAEALPVHDLVRTFDVDIVAEEQGAGDVTAPTLVSAVIDSAGTALTLTYNEALDETSEPATTAWTLAGTSSAVTARNVTGSTVVLTLSPAAYRHETITLDYTAPGTNIQDLAGNDAANLNDQAVTNNTAARWDDLLAIFGGTPHWFLSADNGIEEAGGAGDGVSTWQDSSSANKDATQISSGTARPDINATGLNGHGFVAFTKTSGHWMEFATWDPPAPGTTPIFFWGILRPKSYASGDNLFSCSSTTILRCRMSATANTIGCANPTAGPVVTFTANTWYRLEALFANSADVNTGDYTQVGATATARGTSVGNSNGGNGTFRLCTDLVTRFGDIDWACLIALQAEPSGAQKTLADAWGAAYYGGSVSF